MGLLHSLSISSWIEMRNFELDLHLSDKGWQVLHVPTFDSGTTVPTFIEASG